MILTSIEVVKVALIEVANNSDTGILTIETEHIGQFMMYECYCTIIVFIG